MQSRVDRRLARFVAAAAFVGALTPARVFAQSSSPSASPASASASPSPAHASASPSLSTAASVAPSPSPEPPSRAESRAEAIQLARGNTDALPMAGDASLAVGGGDNRWRAAHSLHTPDRDFGFVTAAEIGYDVGTVPLGSPMFVVQVGARYHAARFMAAARYVFPRQSVVTADPDYMMAGGQFDLLALGFLGSFDLTRGALRIAPTAGIEFGALRAFGMGVPAVFTDSALWCAVIIAINLEWRLSRSISLLGEIGAAVPLLRPKYVISERVDGIDTNVTVHQASEVAFRGVIGPMIYF